MRTLALTVLLSSFALAPLLAQDPPPPAGSGGPPAKQDPAKQDPAKQDPAKKDPAKQDPAKQDPAKKDPAKQDPATQDPAKQDPAKKDPAKQDPAQKDPAAGADEVVPEIVIPASADPADIRAMRSANAMLQAESRLKKLLREGKLKDIDQILSFEEISAWPYQDGLEGMPESIKKLNGKKVMMTGFMLPIDEVENIKEFLLVQSLWSCCYGQPPDINGIVRVVMKGDARVDYMFDPIKIVGEFKVEAYIEDGYCVDIYQLHTDDVTVIK